MHFTIPLLQDLNSYWSDLHLLRPNLMWIAMVPPQGVHDRRIREDIFTYFYDYHILPVDFDRLLVTLGHAYGMAVMGREVLIDRIQDDADQLKIIGDSPAMQAVQHSVGRFARSDAPVLITGENGTGKEVAAILIHQKSQRANGPFVAINCAALPENLIQAELFGYEKGAFTGAYQRKLGRIEEATGGTLFLDEIGDLPLALQVNLLRVLQEGYIERLGSNKSIKVDVRVIAATNHNLPQAVEEGRFREDLYYRLHVLHLQMPSLREREEDIELLAWYFFRKFVKEDINHRIRGVSSEALHAMKHYDWPGNVRELINCIRRAMVMCDTRLIKASDLGLDRRLVTRRHILNLKAARDEAEKEAINASLRRTSNNISHAACQLGITRGMLYKLMAKHGITVRIRAAGDDNGT
jgi:Response regulator containing CheY-like receiver, AAA-type ATPase, and DNA-binding domains